MSGIESTHRDLAVIKGYEYVPVAWSQVTLEDTVLTSVGGKEWHVVYVEKFYEEAMFGLVCGKRQVTVQVKLNDPVHVLDHVTGARAEAHAGGQLVRNRKGRS